MVGIVVATARRRPRRARTAKTPITPGILGAESQAVAPTLSQDPRENHGSAVSTHHGRTQSWAQRGGMLLGGVDLTLIVTHFV